jgi:hypothetical protein
MLTILCTVQLVIIQLSADETLSKSLVHWLLMGGNVLGIIIAQIKRSSPPGGPPMKKKR